MKQSVTIISGEQTRQIEVPAGSNLLKVFQENHIELYTPCGGKGTCGKCEVGLEGGITVTACTYHVQGDLTVILPDRRFSEVQVSQYLYTREVPFVPGEEAGWAEHPVGLAIDLGTTTIAYYKVDLLTGSLVGISTALNPQSRFGADVISRIDHCMTHEKGLQELRGALLGEINAQLESAVNGRVADPESCTRVVITGNTTMLHIFRGTDPGTIALAPFTPVFTNRVELSGVDAGLHCHPEARVILLPSLSGYVGADIISGIASLDVPEIPVYLFLDIGTNGEMALVTPGRIWTCATAAGPAFEGANISCGSGAFNGAISKYGPSGFSTIGNAKPVSICGSGLIDLVAFLVDEGLVTGDGKLEETFLVSHREDNGIEADIVFTRQDIREVQLAKAAVAAGINLLLKHSGYSFDRVDRLFLAGGFGNYMDIASALTIGLLPPEMEGRIVQVGNTAGTGGLLALKSEKFIRYLETVKGRMEYIELSYDEDFPQEFAMQMDFRV